MLELYRRLVSFCIVCQTLSKGEGILPEGGGHLDTHIYAEAVTTKVSGSKLILRGKKDPVSYKLGGRNL